MDVVLVLNGDVVEDVLPPAVHAAEAVLQDHGELVGEGGIVGEEVGGGQGVDVALAVLVLKALPRQGGAPRRGPEEEAPGALVGGGPDEVPDPLQAEHGVGDEEGDGGDAPVGVGGPGGDELGHGPGLGDPLLQDLPLLALLVGGEGARVHGDVELPLGE